MQTDMVWSIHTRSLSCIDLISCFLSHNSGGWLMMTLLSRDKTDEYKSDQIQWKEQVCFIMDNTREQDFVPAE